MGWTRLGHTARRISLLRLRARPPALAPAPARASLAAILYQRSPGKAAVIWRLDDHLHSSGWRVGEGATRRSFGGSGKAAPLACVVKPQATATSVGSFTANVDLGCLCFTAFIVSSIMPGVTRGKAGLRVGMWLPDKPAANGLMYLSTLLRPICISNVSAACRPSRDLVGPGANR